MSARTLGGGALLALAALMLLGVFRSGASITSPAAIGALLIAVALPAAGGWAILRGGIGRRSARAEMLRQQTIDAEILRMAMQHGGRLTAVEVAPHPMISVVGLIPSSAGLASRAMGQWCATVEASRDNDE